MQSRMKSLKIAKTPAPGNALDNVDDAIALSWAALDEAEKLDMTKAERAVLNAKIIASAVFGKDFDGVIERLTRRPGQPRACPVKNVESDDVVA
jgi:hypothetical protein